MVIPSCPALPFDIHRCNQWMQDMERNAHAVNVNATNISAITAAA